jgi:D-methionine transport system substrate-binding protein
VTVKIGTTEASADYWPILIKLAAAQGIDIQTVNFGDYTQANPALSQGQLDLNLFQHLLYLASYNVSTNDTLTPIGSTVVVPLGVYSQKYGSLDQIPRGGQVTIPNDPTNQARALLVLQQAGLIKLTDGGNVLSTPADIDKAASKVTVTPVDAKQTVTSLPSVDAAVINNNFALDAKLDPSKALYNDDPSKPAAQPYINAFVSRAADKDNPTYLKIAALYHDPAVIKAVVDASEGTAVIVTKPEAELRTILSDLEQTVRDAQ